MFEPAESIDDHIAAWDAGETVWSISMGGLGPGYEQAIQITAIEFARATRVMTKDWVAERDEALFEKLCDEALKRFDDSLGGISGAMYGAAKWLAWQWNFNGGPAELCRRYVAEDKSERCIQVRKVMPAAPPPPPEDFPEWPEGVP